MFGKLFGRRREFQVWVHDGDRQIDLYPLAEEVLQHAPHPCGMDALRVAELARRGFNGTYIRVGEYPEGVDRDYAKLVIGRVKSWARWQRKAESIRKARFKRYEIKTGHEPCPRMQERSGKVIERRQIERLPLNDCWRNCQCWYAIARRR